MFRVLEKASQAREYILAQYALKKSPSKGLVELLVRGIRDEIEFFTFKDTEEMVYFDDDEQRYMTNGEIRIRQIVESIILSAQMEREVTNNMVREVVGHIQRASYVDREEFDNPELTRLPFKNGIYDIKDGTLNKYTKEDMFLFRLNVAYDPSATCPEFMKFVDSISVDPEGRVDERMKKAIIQLFAYSLWRAYPIQKMCFLIGAGANGKGVLLGALQRFLGPENTSNCSVTTLAMNRFASSDLFRKHANITNELTVGELYNADILKTLTSGTDHVRAEQKFEKGFSFQNYAKILIATNAPPQTKDATDGFYRRILLFQFVRQFYGSEAIKDLLNKVSTEKELSGILNLALAELKTWLNDDGTFNPEAEFANTLSVDDTREIYERLSDNVSAFIYECLELTGGDEDTIEKPKLYLFYRNYCKNRKCALISDIKFWRDFHQKTVGITTEKRLGKERKYVIAGVKIKAEVVQSGLLNVVTNGNNNGSTPNIPLEKPTYACLLKEGLCDEESGFSDNAMIEKIERNVGRNTIKLKITQNLPEWVGQNQAKYGPYISGDVVEIDKIEGENLCTNKCAEKVE